MQKKYPYRIKQTKHFVIIVLLTLPGQSYFYSFTCIFILKLNQPWSFYDRRSIFQRILQNVSFVVNVICGICLKLMRKKNNV